LVVALESSENAAEHVVRVFIVEARLIPQKSAWKTEKREERIRERKNKGKTGREREKHMKVHTPKCENTTASTHVSSVPQVS
jgi:hypothetical protein